MDLMLGERAEPVIDSEWTQDGRLPPLELRKSKKRPGGATEVWIAVDLTVYDPMPSSAGPLCVCGFNLVYKTTERCVGSNGPLPCRNCGESVCCPAAGCERELTVREYWHGVRRWADMLEFPCPGCREPFLRACTKCLAISCSGVCERRTNRANPNLRV